MYTQTHRHLNLSQGCTEKDSSVCVFAYTYIYSIFVSIYILYIYCMYKYVYGYKYTIYICIRKHTDTWIFLRVVLRSVENPLRAALSSGICGIFEIPWLSGFQSSHEIVDPYETHMEDLDIPRDHIHVQALLTSAYVLFMCFCKRCGCVFRKWRSLLFSM